MFRKNVAPIDRAIHLVAGVLLIAGGLLLLEGLQGSIVGLAVAALGLSLLVTGAIGVCVLYKPFRIDTLRTKRRQATRSSQLEVPVVRRSRDDALR